MLNLFVFVSSFGFGHLTRTIAIIRHILEKSKIVNVHLIGPNAHCDFFMRSFQNEVEEVKNRIRVIPIQTDLGLFYEKHSIEPNIDKSIIYAHDLYVKQKDKKIEILKDIIDGYSNSIIYSDMSPLAFDVAESLKLHSIATSNFDWHSVFVNLNVDNAKLTDKKEEVSQSLYESYRKSDVLIRLPLSDSRSFIPLGKKKVIDVGFFAREKTLTKEEFHHRNAIPNDQKIAYISYGKYMPLNLKRLDSIIKQNPSLAVHFFTTDINDSKGGISSIPSDETESQNWIGNSDFYIGKPGWGTLSECIVNRVKLLLVPIHSNFESQILLHETLKLGGSITLPQSEFMDMHWIRNLDTLEIPEYNDNIDKSGLNTISNYILDLI